MGLDERQIVRTSVALDGGDDLYLFGSGYLIADGLVLTAAHVLERAPGVAAREGQPAEVACPEGDWQPATVAWADADRDVAVLRCPGLGAGSPVRWGRLAGSDPVEWGLVGFPRASMDADAGRQPEHAFGRTSPISERPAGRLALTVESREAAGSDSPWAGLSGAAVFSGEHLIGVITTDPGTYARSLEGRRAEDFASDPNLARLLGGTPPSLENVTGRVREPGLADLRSTLRSRNRAFTGRGQDLAALAAQPQGRMVLTQALTGLGGVGKSALALEYAHTRYDTQDVDVAWWFAAEDRSVLLAAMAGLYARLTGAPGGEDAEQGAVALRNWLERSPYRWLIVFDNAEPGTVEGILPDNGTGQVIITSRASSWPGVSASRVVGLLPEQEAIDLLAQISGLPPDEDARQIAEELGGLALAVEQAAAYIRQTGCSYGDYLEALRSDPATVFAADLAQAESVTGRVWRRSLDRVTDGQDDHPANLMLGVLSYLAPDDIPRQLFNAQALEQVPLLGGLGMAALNLALGELAAYSLINIDRAQDAISVHRVIQHLARLNAESHGREADYCAVAIGLLDACL